MSVKVSSKKSNVASITFISDCLALSSSDDEAH